MFKTSYPVTRVSKRDGNCSHISDGSQFLNGKDIWEWEFLA